MTPVRARYARIERIVSNLLDEHQVREAPVAIEKIVKDHGIALQSGDLGDVSGLLVRHSDSTIIGVNGSHPITRRRFTIAHEFGHYLLHAGLHSHVDRSYRVNFRSAASSEGTDIVEVEANFFAASILMPKSFLENDPDVFDALDNDEGVQRLAEKYRVSGHAMSLRLANVFRTQTPF